jgi:hypothetical protein
MSQVANVVGARGGCPISVIMHRSSRRARIPAIPWTLVVQYGFVCARRAHHGTQRRSRNIGVVDPTHEVRSIEDDLVVQTLLFHVRQCFDNP